MHLGIRKKTDIEGYIHATIMNC